MKNVLNIKELLVFSIFSLSLQFAATVQLAHTSPLLKSLGAPEKLLANLWLSGPIIGLIAGVIFGQLSDMTVTRYGKRKPYLFVCGIALSLALIFLPQSHNLWQAAMLLCLFYAGVNGCMWPLQALIGDNVPKKHLAAAYAVQAVGAGLGGLAAGVLTGSLGEKLQKSFSLKTQSLSLINLGFFAAAFMVLSATFLICYYARKPAQDKTPAEAFTLKNFNKKLSTFRKNLYENILKPPAFLKKILLSQLFLWYAVYGIWVYLPLAVKQHFSSEQGASLPGDCYAVSQIAATLITLCLPLLLKKISEGKLFVILTFIGGLSLIFSMITQKIFILFLSMAGMGILMGSYMALPMIALTKELPEEKRGAGLGVFNLTITGPQILSGVSIGLIQSFFLKNQPENTIIFSGVLIFIAAVISFYQFFIKTNKS